MKNLNHRLGRPLANINSTLAILEITLKDINALKVDISKNRGYTVQDALNSLNADLADIFDITHEWSRNNDS